MAIFTESRVGPTDQGPVTVTAVYDSDTYQIEWTVTTANGITATYTDTNQLRGINGADRFALSRQLLQQGVKLPLRDAIAIDLVAATLGRNVTKLARESLSAAQSAGQEAQAAAPQGPTASPPQVAKADGAVVTAPPVTAPSNAVVTPTIDNGGGDSGTNAPMRTLGQTQATPAATPSSQAPPVAPSSPGVGANDNNPQATGGTARSVGDTTQSERSALDAGADNYFTQTNINTTGENLKILPQPNILDRFSSYTYRASWYLMTPEQYKQLVVNSKRNVNGYMLLMQSGGAPPNSGGPQGASGANNKAIAADAALGGLGAGVTATSIPGANDADAGRNPFFPQDFYFDSITVDNLIIGNGSRAAHSVSTIKFTVVEPSNISLLDRLYDAVQDFMPASGQKQNINYTSVVYLMVIKFYGYDENGNLVTNIGAMDQSGRTDPNAVVEKYIPFKITQCDFTVENKLVSYQIEGKAPNEIVAAGTRRGTIPYDIRLTAKSLGELLGADVVYSDAVPSANTPGASTTTLTEADRQAREAEGFTEPPPPPNANAASSAKKTLSQGLMGALNDFQQQLVRNGIYDYADTYRIVFAAGGPGGGGGAIEKAKLIPPGTIVDKKNLPTAPPPTNSAFSADMQKIFSDISARNYSITAGMQIVQAIDLAIRNSDFIYNQQTKFFPENNSASTPEEASQAGTGRDVVWYNITFQAIPRAGQYDKKRNDYAYDITFIINTYVPMNYASNFFPINSFRGLHKSYPYWFTGQNTAVLEYKETLNNLYNLTISGSADKDNLLKRQLFTSSMRDQPYFSYQSASSESRQGVSGKENEPGSNLAANLYDPVGLANVQMKIVGDPAWIQQGSFVSGASAKNFNFNAFLPDGTINFDARQIMFEVAWQRPQDYDLNSGLADPYTGSGTRQPIQSRVYTASKVTSVFERGQFTQNLHGLLYFFMKPDANNKATSAPRANSANQSDGRATDVATNNRLPSAPTSVATGPRSVPAAIQGEGSATPGTFNAAPPGPNDTVAPRPPPQPATSNGDVTAGAPIANSSEAAGQPVPVTTDATIAAASAASAVNSTIVAGRTEVNPNTAPPVLSQPLPNGSGSRVATARVTVPGVGTYLYDDQSEEPFAFQPDPAMSSRDY